MGELATFMQSSLLLLPQSRLCTSMRGHPSIGHIRASFAVTSPLRLSSTRAVAFPTLSEQKHRSWRFRAGVISDSKVPTTFTVDSAGAGIDVLPDSGGSDDSFGGMGGKGGGDDGGGGGGGSGGGGGKNEEGSGGSENPNGGRKEQAGLSMSQKLTLGYAALVGIGGVMGFLKGGSLKSLVAGGLSASILYFVFIQLPSNPVLASSVGFVLSASLLGVMGSRFKKSGKIFPAGIVSFVSLIMSGGYVHGILRSLH